MAIDQVLAQIRSLSAQTTGRQPGGSRAQRTQRPAAEPASPTLLRAGHRCRSTRAKQSASALADAWERGTPGVDLAQVMIESQKAGVSFRALTEVRNRLVSAYQDIMNMPI